MAYIIKTKKGVPLRTGGKTRGGVLRTAGNRVWTCEKKKQAQYAINRIAKRYKTPEKQKKVKNSMYIKKI